MFANICRAFPLMLSISAYHMLFDIIYDIKRDHISFHYATLIFRTSCISLILSHACIFILRNSNIQLLHYFYIFFTWYFTWFLTWFVIWFLYDFLHDLSRDCWSDYFCHFTCIFPCCVLCSLFFGPYDISRGLSYDFSYGFSQEF